ncbi:MAG TPA: hypothetical protein VHA78_02170 [Candidatus Peribacteraceae bacterium]|nr:hypothetical protein [Candidatus Peribacteraceae bacterium]
MYPETMPCDDPMLADALSDWQQFRSIVGEFRERMRRDHPKIEKDRWDFRCHDSYEVFLTMFPTPQSRKDILLDQWRFYENLREGVHWAREKADEICRNGSQALKEASRESEE